MTSEVVSDKASELNVGPEKSNEQHRMAQQLAKAIAVPAHTTPQRFPSFPALERTAVMGFNANTTLAVASTASSSNVNRVMLCRSAFYPLWYNTQGTAGSNGTSWGITYQTSYLEATATPQTWDTTVIAVSGMWSKSYSEGEYPATTKTPLAGTDNGVFGVDEMTGPLPWVYVPVNSSAIVSVSKFGTPFEATVTLEWWNGPGTVETFGSSWSMDSSGADQPAGKAISFGQNTWVRAKVVALTTNTNLNVPIQVSVGVATGNVSPIFTASGTSGVWGPSQYGATDYMFVPATCSSEWSNSILPWKAARLTAVAALFTNTTKVLNKEGTALWGRIGPNVKEPYNITESDLATLHPAEKSYMGLEKGCYAYNPPSEDLAEFRNYTYRSLFGTTNVAFPIHRLDDRAYICHGVFSDPDGGTTLAVNLDWHIEFRTSSTLFQIGVSTTPLENLHTAQIALLKAGFFFSNDMHAGIISKIIGALGTLHPLLRVAAPLASGLLSASSLAVGRKTKTIQATTARSVGLTPQARPARGRSRSRRARTQPGTRPQTLQTRLPPFKFTKPAGSKRRAR